MKRLLLILILTLSLQSWTKADDIKDIEIEGMSIGKSILEIMTKEEIESDMSQMYKSKKFSTVIYKKSDVYDSIQFSFLTSNKKFIIEDIEAKLIFKYNIKDCRIKQKEITESIENIVGNDTEYWPLKKQIRKSDPSGKSIMYAEAFVFDEDESMIQIYCTDWSEEFEKKEWHDELKVSIWSASFSKFLDIEAY